MKSVVTKINIILIISTCILMLVILFVDNQNLSSLFINYDDNLVINEVSILNVDYNKVIYTDNSNQSNNEATHVNNDATSSNSNPTLLNRVASLDYWAWPTERNYTITTYYSSGHKAIDIYSGYGSNIYAANNGVVSSVKGGCSPGNISCNGRGGNYIIINHNSGNYYTIYMHLKDIRVNVGDTVTRGQVIGTMGNTGNVIPVPTSSAPYLGTHLHFCLYVGEPFRGGYAINPMSMY